MRLSTYQTRHVSHPLERELQDLSPQNRTSGCASIFIGPMVFHHLGLDADLQVVNGILATNSSQLVFPSTPLSLKDLRTRMKAHFEKKPALPVMLENETFTFAIVGYGEDRGDPNLFRLWVADPHVGKGVNKKESPDVGLYTIEYDNEGRGVRTNFSEPMRGKMFMGGVSFDSLYLGFQLQCWVVLFPGDAER